MIFKWKYKKLSEQDMKDIAVEQKKDYCAYSERLTDSIICVDSAYEAETKAGEHGWWACNTEEVKKACK